MRKQLILSMTLCCLWLLKPTEARSKYVSEEEDNPYEFGFTIDGQQHRHEKKDANGVIQGEFGFITADGIYHVTVYATDENGNFKILSMRNVRVSGPLDDPNSSLPDTSQFSKGQPSPAANPLSINSSPAPVQAVTTPPKPVTQSNPFTTQPTIKPACAGCGYVTHKTPLNANNNNLPFQTQAGQNPKPGSIVIGNSQQGPVHDPQSGFIARPGANAPFVSNSAAQGQFNPSDYRPQHPTQDHQQGNHDPNINIPPGQTPHTTQSGVVEISEMNQHAPAQNTPDNSDLAGITHYRQNLDQFGSSTPVPLSIGVQQTPANAVYDYTTSSTITPPSRVVEQNLSEQSQYNTPSQSFDVQQIPVVVLDYSPSSTLAPQSPQEHHHQQQNTLPRSFNAIPDLTPSSTLAPRSSVVEQQPNTSPQSFGVQQTSVHSVSEYSPSSTLAPESVVVELSQQQHPHHQNTLPQSFGVQQAPHNIPLQSSDVQQTPISAVSSILAPESLVVPQHQQKIPPTSKTNQETFTDQDPLLNPLTISNPNNHLNQNHQPDTNDAGITVSNGQINVPNNPPIKIQDKYPNMVDGLPDGITQGDITDLLYRFNYTVGFHGHYEKGYKNGAKVGGYFVNDRDGVSRIVTYVADENGYRPKVKFIRLDLNSDLVPKEGTEKTFGLKNFEFVWYPLN